jgi:molecular chaperone DnaK (HSP70)
MPRYFVGIDLGTTNTAVASAPVDGDGTITTFPIPQVVSPGEVEPLATLPSFLLLPTEHEVPPEGLSVPWADRPPFTIGTLARERGAELPHRLVSSAKSWLCHTGVDRHGPILPWRRRCTSNTCDRPGTTPTPTIRWRSRRSTWRCPPPSMQPPAS